MGKLKRRERVKGYKLITKRVPVVVAIILLCFCGVVWAADYSLTPSLELKEEYNDNIFLEANHPEQDFITTLAPKLEFGRAKERLNLNLSGRLGVVSYSENSDLSAVDQNYLSSVAFQNSPRLGTSLNLEYLTDHRPDRDYLVSGLLFNAVRRDRWVAGTGFNYALTERSRLESGYSYAKETFPKGEYADSETNYLSSTYSYDWSKRVTQTLALSYSHTEYDSARVDNVVLLGGIRTVLAELWQVEAGVGGQYTRTNFEVLDGYLIQFPEYIPVYRDENSDDVGVVANAQLSYRTDNTRVTTGFRHDVQLASGRTGAVMLTSLTLDVTRRLHRTISGYFRGGYYLNRTDEQELASEKIDDRSLRLSVGLHWDLTRDWGASINYEYARFDDRVDDITTKRNLIVMRILYRIPLWD